MVLFWIYLLTSVILYRKISLNHRKIDSSKSSSHIAQLESVIDFVKRDVIHTVEKSGLDIVAKEPKELLSFHEKVQFMDVVGVPQKYQHFLTRFFILI